MDSNVDKLELEKKKLVLEQKKIELEIKELEKSWFKKPAILLSLIPSIVAITSLIWAFNSGFLDLKTEKLNIQKENLSLDIRRFETQKNTLYKEKQNLIHSKLKITNERDSMRASLDKYIKALNNGDSKQSVYIKLLVEQNKEYSEQIDLLESELIDRNNEISILNGTTAKNDFVPIDLGFDEKNNNLKEKIKTSQKKIQNAKE